MSIRRSFVYLLVFAALLSPAALTYGQHEGHNMPMQSPQVTKSKPARRAGKARAIARKKSVRKAAVRSAPAHDSQHSGQMDHGGMDHMNMNHGDMNQMKMGGVLDGDKPAVPSTTGPETDHQHTSGTSVNADMPKLLPEQVTEKIEEEDLPGPAITLPELEEMARRASPTIVEAEAAIRAAEGRRRQAGLWPNPVVGYLGQELSLRAASRTSEHMFFVEQAIPLGGKLGKSKRVYAQEKAQAEIIAEAQTTRVSNAIRSLYYDALGAQKLVELRRSLARLAHEAVATTAELYYVGQADRPDHIEIDIEAQRADIELLRAENDRAQVWRLIGALTGKPELTPMKLEGVLDDASPELNEGELLNSLLANSPEVKMAQAGVERARAVLARAKAQRMPDLFLRGGGGYNNEITEWDARPVGKEGFIEAGITLPIFNRNQGGITTAQAELAMAEQELLRVQMALRARFSPAFHEYKDALQIVSRYRDQVIPKARSAYEMYRSNFSQMAASYPQVLIAQRTYFQVQTEYARALATLRRSAVGLQGQLLRGGFDPLPRAGSSGSEGTSFSPSNEIGGSTNRIGNDAEGQ